MINFLGQVKKDDISLHFPVSPSFNASWKTDIIILNIINEAPTLRTNICTKCRIWRCGVFIYTKTYTHIYDAFLIAFGNITWTRRSSPFSATRACRIAVVINITCATIFTKTISTGSNWKNVYIHLRGSALKGKAKTKQISLLRCPQEEFNVTPFSTRGFRNHVVLTGYNTDYKGWF